MHGSGATLVANQLFEIHSNLKCSTVSRVSIASEQEVQEILTRIDALDASFPGSKIPDPRPGMLDRNMAKIIMDMLNNLNKSMEDLLCRSQP